MLQKNLGNNKWSYIIGFEDKSYLDGSGWIPDASYDPTSREWYKVGFASDKVQMTTPYLSAADKEPLVTMAKKTSVNGKSGVLAVDLGIAELSNMTNAIKIEKTGYASIINKDGGFIAHPKYTIDDNISSVDVLAPVASMLTKADGTQFEHSGKLYQTYPIANTNWLLVLSVPKGEVLSHVNALGRFMLIARILFVIAISAIIYFISNTISTPIIRLSSDVATMSNYDMTLTDESPSVIYSKNKDEIGDISRSLIQVKHTMKDTLTAVNDIASQVSTSSEQLTATSEQSAMSAEEAARAGEAGKGFAVVAEEIMNEVGKIVGEQSERVNETKEQFDVIAHSLDQTKESVEKLNASGKKMETTKDSLLSIIENLSALSEENAASAQEIASASSNLADMAQDMSEMISKFKL